jgi:hypothetical protein
VIAIMMGERNGRPKQKLTKSQFPKPPRPLRVDVCVGSSPML